MNGKKWIKVFVVMSFLCISIIGSFNYYYDSLGLVNKNGFLNKASDDIVKGKYLIGLKNYNERVFNEKIIGKLNNEVEFLVLGSSRSMLIRHRNLPLKVNTFFNASVSNGIFGDILNLLFVYEKRFKKLPKNILINIDPWLFNSNNPEKRYLEMKEYYIQMLNRISVNASNSSKYIKKNNLNKLFSMEYFKTNLIFMKDTYQKGYKGYYSVNSLDGINENHTIKEPDGSIHYPNSRNNKSITEIKEESNKWIDSHISQFRNYNKITNKDIFEKLLTYLSENNVNIIVNLSPFNPFIYDKLISKYPLIPESEKYIKSLTEYYNIEIIGSYSPYQYTNKGNDFTDYMHTKENITNNILNEITSK